MKKVQVLLLTAVASMALVACSQPGTSTSTSQTPGTSSSSSSSSSSTIQWDGKTNEDFEYAATTYVENGVEKPLTMNTIYRNSNAPHLDSLKDQRVLVVPFGFKDEALKSVQTQATIDRINTTFFGKPGDVDVDGWFSVKTFYETSSYGLAKFEGTVLPNWCVFNGTASQFGAGGASAASYARKWYLEEYAKPDHGQLGADAEPLTYFDQDGDGFIDLIWVVYSHPIVENSDWWAYVTYTTNTANVQQPSVKTLGWASIGFMDEGFGGYDPHTFIHETGHTFGLADYYDYNGSWAPMGGVDFMDHNLGDHSMYSKFTLGWTSPLVVDDTALITLRPGTTTGDCFIIPSPGYNGTAFDEYMMFELMAPTGIAEFDYKNGYKSTNGYSQPGIRITHVDSRVYKGNWDATTTENPQEGKDIRVGNTKGGRTGVGYDSDYWPHTNSKGQVEKEYYTHINIMESDYDEEQNWKTAYTFNASNKSLFKKNHTFDLDPSVEGGWAQLFMPSRSNLWNKAKVNVERSGTNIKKVEIDETCTFNYEIQVLSIVEDAEYGWVATVKVLADRY